ncbi:hypothetical protein LSTR_LSTR005506 [Laodelphax striatellus]|uniref:Uncharacterized protein n=1 Tax=Laodelphax striatellus TaxID=195883 RepID=A0A482WXA6_LAOST|nr:hypothetical protein LSTR_LSTR005506 [Laodelphax striatellus]
MVTTWGSGETSEGLGGGSNSAREEEVRTEQRLSSASTDAKRRTGFRARERDAQRAFSIFDSGAHTPYNPPRFLVGHEPPTGLTSAAGAPDSTHTNP